VKVPARPRNDSSMGVLKVARTQMVREFIMSPVPRPVVSKTMFMQSSRLYFWTNLWKGRRRSSGMALGAGKLK